MHNIAEGRIDVSPVLTGVMPPERTNDAFEASSSAEDHAKIVVSFEEFPELLKPSLTQQ